MSYVVLNMDDVKDLGGNQIIGSPTINNSKIVFTGTNNILYCEDGVSISDSTINFKSDNALIVLRKSRHAYILKMAVWNDCVFCMGRDNYINGALSGVVSERQNIFIGDNGLFSFGIWIRTADPHLIYDCETGKRLNPSKSVFIGDHVWVGQDVKLLKGTVIGSGSIVAAGAVVAGKTINSNTSWGGVPPKQLAKNVFFLSNSVHAYTEEKTDASMSCDSKKWIYGKSDNSWAKVIDNNLKDKCSAEAKLAYICEEIFEDSSKNRYAIVTAEQEKSSHKRKMRKALRKIKKKLFG